MICSRCKEHKPIENKDLELCATCNKKRRDVDDKLYPGVRKDFLAMCIKFGIVSPIDKTEITMDSDIHHKMGRTGYADKWARDNDISLLIDARFFLAVSRTDHQWIELNPVKAKELGYSYSRLAKHETETEEQGTLF